MKKYGVIMAGGGGTRFWPLSRQKTPKQLLNLSGKELMINETIDRLCYTVDKKDIFIVTNESQVETMRKVTEARIEKGHILSEPCARNTAACIGYAAIEIIKKYGDGIMVITPSDAYIRDTQRFTRVLSEAVKVAEMKDKLVTIGISPTFPATGYGYIKYDKTQREEAKLVLEFKEKPDDETAKEYLSTGMYAWNSGMFVWKASTILRKFKQYVPDIYNDLLKISDALGNINELKVINEVYSHIRKISIDYAIMEPAGANGDVLVIPGEFGWNDVGSWDMLDSLHEKDKDGNVRLGDTIAINTTNSVIYADQKMVATVGVKDLVVVETADVVMVCSKEKAQDVKLLVDALQIAGRSELL